MQAAVHEFMGHGRQEYNNYGGNRPELDFQVLSEQARLGGPYVKLADDEKAYDKQPAEIHAYFIADAFRKEFMIEKRNVKLIHGTLFDACLQRAEDET